MGREYKKRRNISRKLQHTRIKNLEKAHDQRRNPLGERTNIVQMQSPTKVIKGLKNENEGLRKKAKAATQKYWNARRRTLKLEKAAAAWKVDQKQAKVDATRLGKTNYMNRIMMIHRLYTYRTYSTPSQKFSMSLYT